MDQPGGGDPARVDPVEPGEEGGGALVLAGVQSGEGGARLVEGARERLLLFVYERAAFAPAEGVETQHDMAAAGEFVAGEAAVEVTRGPSSAEASRVSSYQGRTHFSLPMSKREPWSCSSSTAGKGPVPCGVSRTPRARVRRVSVTVTDSRAYPSPSGPGTCTGS